MSDLNFIFCSCGRLIDKMDCISNTEIDLIQCEDCHDPINNPSTIMASETVKCNCGKFCDKYDISTCSQCEITVCTKCQWESNMNTYCEKCITLCSMCSLETYYYKDKRFTCISCGHVFCENCLNFDSKCYQCAK